jgi:hypothetical protein
MGVLLPLATAPASIRLRQLGRRRVVFEESENGTDL